MKLQWIQDDGLWVAEGAEGREYKIGTSEWALFEMFGELENFPDQFAAGAMRWPTFAEAAAYCQANEDALTSAETQAAASNPVPFAEPAALTPQQMFDGTLAAFKAAAPLTEAAKLHADLEAFTRNFLPRLKALAQEGK